MLLRRMEKRESDQAQCQLIAKRKGKRGKKGTGKGKTKNEKRKRRNVQGDN